MTANSSRYQPQTNAYDQKTIEHILTSSAVCLRCDVLDYDAEMHQSVDRFISQLEEIENDADVSDELLSQVSDRHIELLDLRLKLLNIRRTQTATTTTTTQPKQKSKTKKQSKQTESIDRTFQCFMLDASDEPTVEESLECLSEKIEKLMKQMHEPEEPKEIKHVNFIRAERIKEPEKLEESTKQIHEPEEPKQTKYVNFLRAERIKEPEKIEESTKQMPEPEKPKEIKYVHSIRAERIKEPEKPLTNLQKKLADFDLCIYCQKEHSPDICPLPISDRVNFLKRHKICFKCMRCSGTAPNACDGICPPNSTTKSECRLIRKDVGTASTSCS